jgi:hypothetical protein
MDNYQLTQDQITAYGVCLRTEEHTPGTIEKYLRDNAGFCRVAGGPPVTRGISGGVERPFAIQRPQAQYR